MDQDKVCRICKLSKKLDEFHKDRSAKSGKRSFCKDCARVRYDTNRSHYNRNKRAWYQDNQKKVKSQIRDAKNKRKKERPLSWILERLKTGAKRRGHECTITVEDFPEGIPTHCPVFGVPLAPTCSGSPWAPSFDRLDSEKGYVPGNVRIISRKANIIKNMGTAEDHEAIARWMRKEGAK